MTSPADPSGITGIVEQALQSLRQATGAGQQATGQPSGGEASGEPPTVEGHGEAAGGLITVTAVPGGRLQDLRIDARAMRLTSEELAEEILNAANAALGDLQLAIRGAVGAPDLEGLTESLKKIQEQAVPQMRTFLETLTATQERIAASGR
jgi:DNA-binding protein YbaB